MSVRNVG